MVFGFVISIYVEFLSTGRGSLFSSLLLCRIIDITCCIAMVLITMKVCLIVSFGILNFSSKIFIEGMCVVAVAPAVITINGSTFHPLLVILSISGWYFSVLRVMVSVENLSLQYVNSMNWILRLSIEVVGGFAWYGSPLTHIISGLNLALQWHLWRSHVQGSNHGGTVFSSGLSLNDLAFIRM